MKFYKLSIGSPVYQQVYSYSTKKTKKIVKDECRKHLILRFCARTLCFEDGQKDLDKIISRFIALTGCTEIKDLSKVPWGEKSIFDEKKLVFEGAICIPKDFDNLEGQKKSLKLACKEYENEHNRCTIKRHFFEEETFCDYDDLVS